MPFKPRSSKQPLFIRVGQTLRNGLAGFVSGGAAGFLAPFVAPGIAVYQLILYSDVEIGAPNPKVATWKKIGAGILATVAQVLVMAIFRITAIAILSGLVGAAVGTVAGVKNSSSMNEIFSAIQEKTINTLKPNAWRKKNAQKNSSHKNDTVQSEIDRPSQASTTYQSTEIQVPEEDEDDEQSFSELELEEEPVERSLTQPNSSSNSPNPSLARRLSNAYEEGLSLSETGRSMSRSKITSELLPDDSQSQPPMLSQQKQNSALHSASTTQPLETTATVQSKAEFTNILKAIYPAKYNNSNPVILENPSDSQKNIWKPKIEQPTSDPSAPLPPSDEISYDDTSHSVRATFKSDPVKKVDNMLHAIKNPTGQAIHFDCADQEVAIQTVKIAQQLGFRPIIIGEKAKSAAPELLADVEKYNKESTPTPKHTTPKGP